MTAKSQTPAVSADVLVVGAGGAGMYAAIAAARNGASVVLLDKSIVGRGGATIMAQMTVAAAIGSEEPDDWKLHYADTVKAGKGLCNEELALALCQDGPDRILEMGEWGTNWAKEGDRIKQVQAPGHSRKRCVYVDILNTGPATATTLLSRLNKHANIRRISNITVTDLVISGGRCIGAVGIDLTDSKMVHFHAGAVILAAGGLTQLYRRNSASSNMTGDAHALALRAGASLVDMEFVQFFPIANLSPRLVGMDPIMWDPFRYKLGGRLFNGRMEEFLDKYGQQDGGKYTATRDIATYAIIKEVEAGRGTPNGGAYLDFRHLSEEELRAGFGPVIDRLLKNGIDLTKMPVEVAPMAHYHMGGLRCNGRMESVIPGLYGAGEAVGGAQGASRMSGNAITEAFVFGERAGRHAAAYVGVTGTAGWDPEAAVRAEGVVREVASGRTGSRPERAAQVCRQLQEIMGNLVGPLRTEVGLIEAVKQIGVLRREVVPNLAVTGESTFNMDLLDWLNLRNMVDAAEVIATAALERRESRGAHVRIDAPETDEHATANILVHRSGGELVLQWTEVIRTGVKV